MTVTYHRVGRRTSLTTIQGLAPKDSLRDLLQQLGIVLVRRRFTINVTYRFAPTFQRDGCHGFGRRLCHNDTNGSGSGKKDTSPMK